MFAIMLALFIVVSAVLMVVVLLQSSKGGGLAGAFGGGGGSDSSVLGGRGTASFLSKITVYLAVSFMALAVILSIMSSRARVADEDAGIIAKRQQEGALDVYNVQEGGSILDELQTEGFEAADEGTGAAVETEAKDAAEPAPSGDQP